MSISIKKIIFSNLTPVQKARHTASQIMGRGSMMLQRGLILTSADKEKLRVIGDRVDLDKELAGLGL